MTRPIDLIFPIWIWVIIIILVIVSFVITPVENWIVSDEERECSKAYREIINCEHECFFDDFLKNATHKEWLDYCVVEWCYNIEKDNYNIFRECKYEDILE